MKKFFKKFLLALTLCMAALTASAKDIDAVMKITVNAPGGWDFLKKTFNVKKDVEPKLADGYKYEKPRSTYNPDEFFMQERECDVKDSLEYSTTPISYYFPIENKDAYYFIPSLARLIVPKGTKYAYAGSWIINIDPETLRISSIELVDEFDQAKEWFEKKYGTKKQLVRAQIVQFDEEEKKEK
ncbi:MAG: hypothetical protein IIT57_04635 [Treponema sp.]|nr:hypothetical protein [Treponema sp.]HBB14439.1 hypothetical protein [Treponema sp.]